MSGRILKFISKHIKNVIIIIIIKAEPKLSEQKQSHHFSHLYHHELVQHK